MMSINRSMTMSSDDDYDQDGISNSIDNCFSTGNADQLNADNDMQGNACDTDDDNDGILDVSDNCPLIVNIDQLDSDSDSVGNVCDTAPFFADAGSLDATFNSGSGMSSTISDVLVQADGKIIIGGYFTMVNGTPRNRIARLNVDGSLDLSFNPGSGANSSVTDVEIQTDGKIIIGGNFTAVNGTAHNRITRLNADGSLDSSFNPGSGADSGVTAVAVQTDGKVIIGGYFAAVNGTPRNRIARLNVDGSLDLSFNSGTEEYTTVNAVLVQADGKIVVGGNFTTVNGIARNRIARLNADGSLDLSFNPGSGASSSVTDVVGQADGKIIIGGTFTTVNGKAYNSIARLNVDGTLDLSFNPGAGASSSVNAVLVQADGRIIIGGNFTTVNGITRNRIARLNTDGSLDSSFNPGSGASSSVTVVAVQTDGKIIIGGDFTTVNGIARDSIARIHSGDSDGDGIEDAADYGRVKNDYNNDDIAGWIWKGVSNGNETSSQNWQLTFPLYSPNWAVPNRFYHPAFLDQANWEIMTSGDFNKDGDADILWRNTTTAEWKVWQMQDGIRVAQNNLADFDMDHAWQVVGAGDTDKDGDDDIILGSRDTGYVMIWEMQGHALVNTHNIGVKPGYTLNRVGDFNKDGDVDLLFRENGSDVLVTWELEQNALVTERTLANTGTNYNPICAGDFDKDGDDDIMLINSATQQEKWFVMENYARTQQFGGTNEGFTFLGCGDYDGDGDTDSLWQRDSDELTRVVLQANRGNNKQTVYSNAFGGANGFVYRGNNN